MSKLKPSTGRFLLERYVNLTQELETIVDILLDALSSKLPPFREERTVSDIVVLRDYVVVVTSLYGEHEQSHIINMDEALALIDIHDANS